MRQCLRYCGLGIWDVRLSGNSLRLLVEQRRDELWLPESYSACHQRVIGRLGSEHANRHHHNRALPLERASARLTS